MPNQQNSNKIPKILYLFSLKNQILFGSIFSGFSVKNNRKFCDKKLGISTPFYMFM